MILRCTLTRTPVCDRSLLWSLLRVRSLAPRVRPRRCWIGSGSNQPMKRRWPRCSSSMKPTRRQCRWLGEGSSIFGASAGACLRQQCTFRVLRVSVHLRLGQLRSTHICCTSVYTAPHVMLRYPRGSHSGLCDADICGVCCLSVCLLTRMHFLTLTVTQAGL
jgi:hypothetical protein